MTGEEDGAEWYQVGREEGKRHPALAIVRQ